MSEPTHSLLPWSTNHHDEILDSAGSFIGILYGRGHLIDERNAALIVRAVNRDALFEEALRKIAGGFIDSSFVMSNPPDWHSAFSQLQKIAQEALSRAEVLK